MKRTTITLLFLTFLLAVGVACVQESPPAGMAATAVPQIVRVVETVDTSAVADEVIDEVVDEAVAAVKAELEATIVAQQAAIDQAATVAENAVTSANQANTTANTAIAEANAASDIANASTNAQFDFALQQTLVELYDRINPSVVYISIEGASGFQVGNGSGWVYDTNGHIVTNNHVVEDAASLSVQFADGTIREAVVVGRDVDSDLAVIRVDNVPETAQPIPVSALNAVDVGQFVIAIGSPFGEEGSLSFGIVSGLGRSLESTRLTATQGRYQLPLVIQTDAPINPGNSGGPLLNLAGEVVGVNSAIATLSGSNSGVGFAIPVDAVSRIAPALITDGAYKYPYMGLGFNTLTPEGLAQIGLEGVNGPAVVNVAPGSPAAVAGFIPFNNNTVGDIVIEIDGRPINTFDDLNGYLVLGTSVGQTINMTVNRNGTILILPLVLGERP